MTEEEVRVRRRDTLARIAGRLDGLPAVSDEEREAVLDAIDDAHDLRADQLIARDPHARYTRFS